MKSIIVLLFIGTCYGDVEFNEGLRNFSIELLHLTLKQTDGHVVISPFGIWTLMTGVSLGATGNSFEQLRRAFILPRTRKTVTEGYKNLMNAVLQPSSNGVSLSSNNFVFVDDDFILKPDFKSTITTDFNASIKMLDFKDPELAARIANNYIKNSGGRVSNVLTSDDFAESRMILTNVISFKGLWASPFNSSDTVNEPTIASLTRNKIPKVVEASDLFGTIIVSAAYFKGIWTSPFNASSISIQPFYNSNGTQIGVVNMMYNSFTYPFANIKNIQARVIELSYGKENRLSMLIMLPNLGVTLKEMFLNFRKVPLNIIFAELQRAREEYSEDEVDCFIPRFKIESNLNLTEILKGMGIYDLFDAQEANLGRVARLPMYVTKVIHKATIEVIEEGTTSAETAGTLPNRNGVVRFEANHPFCYLIVEKVTNTILFGGVYQKPFLY